MALTGWLKAGAPKPLFPIVYQFQKNQGKHVAINRGVTIAGGEFFIIADPDDSFVSDALQILLEAWNAIPKAQRSTFTGVTGLCVDNNGTVVGDMFPKNIFDSNSAQIFYLFGIRGEKWGFHRTEVIKDYPFPELPDMPFFRESIIWFDIAKKYKTRFINQPVRVYEQDGHQQLTKMPIAKRAFENIFYAMSLNNDQEYMFKAPWTFAKMALQGARLSFHRSETMAEQFSRLEGSRVRALWAVALLPGFGLYFYDQIMVRHLRQNQQ